MAAKKKFDKYAPHIDRTSNRYQPKLQEEPVNNRPAKLLFQFGLLFLVMEVLLVLPGVTMGIMMVHTWIYAATAGLALALLLISGGLYAFQRGSKRKIMRFVVITLAVLLLVDLYFFGSLTYLYASSDVGQGVYQAPNGKYGLYVCRIEHADEEGNVVDVVYRGYRCYGKQSYIYEENQVPAADGFTVTWEDNDTAILTSGEQSVTIEFGVEE